MPRDKQERDSDKVSRYKNSGRKYDYDPEYDARLYRDRHSSAAELSVEKHRRGSSGSEIDHHAHTFPEYAKDRDVRRPDDSDRMRPYRDRESDGGRLQDFAVYGDASRREKKHKKKHKRKHSRERGEYDSPKDSQSSAAAKGLVDYQNDSSELSEEFSKSPLIESRSSPRRYRTKSPNTAIQEYKKERIDTRSVSPVRRDVTSKSANNSDKVRLQRRSSPVSLEPSPKSRDAPRAYRSPKASPSRSPLSKRRRSRSPSR